MVSSDFVNILAGGGEGKEKEVTKGAIFVSNIPKQLAANSPVNIGTILLKSKLHRCL